MSGNFYLSNKLIKLIQILLKTITENEISKLIIQNNVYYAHLHTLLFLKRPVLYSPFVTKVK